jgi:hypothetical protein
MTSVRTPRNLARRFLTVASVAALATVGAAAEIKPAGPARNLVLWDTLSPLGDKLNAGDRSSWKAVPDDLLLLEKDPPKASSDPGYYGRDYAFRGDAVVETPTLIAAFWAKKGCVRLYTKQSVSSEAATSETADALGGRIADLFPVRSDSASSMISHVEVVRNSDDEIVLEVAFSTGSPRIAGAFSFEKTGAFEVKPIENMNKVRLHGLLQYGIAPDFIADDLIFSQEQFTTNMVAVSAQNLFLGLMGEESTELVMTWPKGNQRLNLQFGQELEAGTIDFDNDGQNFYVAALTAPGIWHREVLTPDYLEKDIKISWKRPFPAKWKTQLNEEDGKTTFAFRQSRGELWRGVAGSYVYPVWFDGEETFYGLSKKVPPQGESLIYCVEGRDTPVTLLTPVDILRQTLGRQASDSILDAAGRKLRTHHRRAGLGVRRACTCGCTEAIQAVFEAGDEVNQKDSIQGALDDMIYFVHCHVQRINEYRHFADAMLKLIQDQKQSAPEWKPFLDSLEEIAKQIPQEYEVQKENMKTFEYADDLSAKTMALTARKDPDNLKAYMELLKAWRGMGGAQDYVLAKCHIITRSLAQAAGYGCAPTPAAVPLAQEIRARCRQTLRSADGYEIWADY